MEKYGAGGVILQRITITPDEFSWLTGAPTNTPNEGVFGSIECFRYEGGGWRLSKINTPHGCEVFVVNICLMTYHKLFAKRFAINARVSFAKACSKTIWS